MNADRYTVAVIIRFWEAETRYPLGRAPSRRKAKRLGYQIGARHYPLNSSVAVFELEIIDTTTGERVRASGAEVEAWHRAHQIPTVGELGYW